VSAEGYRVPRFRRSPDGTHWHCPECGVYVPRREPLCACGFRKAERLGGRAETTAAAAPRRSTAVLAVGLAGALLYWAIAC